MDDYQSFLSRKSQLGGQSGFEPLWLPDFLFPFQRHLVEWAIRRGRAALFEDCGLGKTPQQLVWAENVVRKTNGRVLILTPLAVSHQTEREARKFGIEAVRSDAGELNSRIVIANYERLHHFNSTDFVGVVCDESSILKSFNGTTRKAITRFMSKMRYRLLCTATAAPNDYVELGTSSEALGELSYSEMLRRFFWQLDDKGQKRERSQQEEAEALVAADPNYFKKLAYRVAQTIGQWRLKHHAVTHFWRWVASWAKACRMPSDLGFENGLFVLPELCEHDHVITPLRPPTGMLFSVPAFGMREERAERRRTMTERCEFVAELVNHDRPAIVWCHMNEEADLLEKLIPGSVQISGADSFEWKEAAILWFCGENCRCELNAMKRRSKLATCQQKTDRQDIGRRGIANTVNNGSHKHLNTQSAIKRNDESISPHTTKHTRRSTNSQQIGKKRKTECGEVDTELTRFTESGTNSKSKNGKQLIHENDLISECGNTELLPTNTSSCSQNREDVALSADALRKDESALADCMLTTATSHIALGDFSAITATSESESSRTIQNSSEKRCPICGSLRESHRVLITKPKIASFGLNLQHCSHVVTFASHSYEQHYQSIRRCWRFGQTRSVDVDVIATEGELRVLGNLRRKAEKADKMFAAIVAEMRNATRVARDNLYINDMEVPTWLCMSR